MSRGPLCPNLTKKVQKEVSQMAIVNCHALCYIGGLSVNLNHLKTENFLLMLFLCIQHCSVCILKYNIRFS